VSPENGPKYLGRSAPYLHPQRELKIHQKTQNPQEIKAQNHREGKKNPEKKKRKRRRKKLSSCNKTITDQMLPEDLALLPRICTRASLLPTLLDNSETCFRTVWPANAVEAHAVVAVAMTGGIPRLHWQILLCNKRTRAKAGRRERDESCAREEGSEMRATGADAAAALLKRMQRNLNSGP
jgi:hypothetical protein